MTSVAPAPTPASLSGDEPWAVFVTAHTEPSASTGSSAEAGSVLAMHTPTPDPADPSSTDPSGTGTGRPGMGGGGAHGSGGVSGRRLPNGELRRRVAAHLARNSHDDFTPGEIARALGDRSSGAVANALDVLAGIGAAVQTSERPVRYRATTRSAHAATLTGPAAVAPSPPSSPPPTPPTAPPVVAGAPPARKPPAASAPLSPTATPASAVAARSSGGSTGSTGSTIGPVVEPVVDGSGAVLRPNGQRYHPRRLAGGSDVAALRKLRAGGVSVLLYGPPGTGKTSVAEAAFPDLITVAGDGDTTVADLVGEYTQTPDGRYVFVHGPLVRAMREGRALLVDDATLIPPSVLAVLYPAMDGRREIVVKANGGEIITAEPGFYVLAGHNPGVHGAVLTDALSSRFALQVRVSTDYDLAKQLKINPKAVRVARNLATRSRTRRDRLGATAAGVAGLPTHRRRPGRRDRHREPRRSRPRGRPRHRRRRRRHSVRCCGDTTGPRRTDHPTPHPHPPDNHQHQHQRRRGRGAAHVRRLGHNRTGPDPMNRHVTHTDPGTTEPGTTEPGTTELGTVGDGDAVGVSSVGHDGADAFGSLATGGASGDEREWARFGGGVGDEANTIADRDDLIVTIPDGIPTGVPAMFLPARAAISIDRAHFPGIDPGTAMPDRDSDRARYPVGWGLLVHECAHARHSLWEDPDGVPAAIVKAAGLLEESRIEALHLSRRPQDRPWLRAAAHHLILAEAALPPPSPPPSPSPSPPRDGPTPAAPITGPAPDSPAADSPTPEDPGTAGTASPVPGSGSGSGSEPVELSAGGVVRAAQLAGLVLARVSAGVLTAAETSAVVGHLDRVLGGERLAALSAIWNAAHTVADDDRDTMIDLGRQWCEVIGEPANTDTGESADIGEVRDVGGGAVGAAAGWDESLLEAAHAVLADVENTVAREVVRLAAADPTARAAVAADEAARAAALTARAARKVFGDITSTGGSPSSDEGGSESLSHISGTRPPTTAERRAARLLGRALDTAGTLERAVTRVSSATPPGRLRMRGVLAADAQRAAGQIPTAQPFTQTRRTLLNPPGLRLGVACDISGSMCAVTGPVASAAWILAAAAAHTRVDTTTASVLFGRNVHPVVAPGQHPANVTEFEAADSYEAADRAIAALDGALGLSLPGAARLLVIVSDGYWRAEPMTAAQEKVTALLASGCGVLWLAPPGDVVALRGSVVIGLRDPARTADTIARAASYRAPRRHPRPPIAHRRPHPPTATPPSAPRSDTRLDIHPCMKRPCTCPAHINGSARR